MSANISTDNQRSSNAGLFERLDSLRSLKGLCRELGYYDIAKRVSRDLEDLERRLACTKIRHSTRAGAEDQLAKLLQLGADRKNPDFMRVYRCQKCVGYWHVGHVKKH